jgi:hypothetical protein
MKNYFTSKIVGMKKIHKICVKQNKLSDFERHIINYYAVNSQPNSSISQLRLIYELNQCLFD